DQSVVSTHWDHRCYRYVRSAAELQAKNERWQIVCVNVFGLEWSQGLRTLMDIRSLSSYKLDGLQETFTDIRFPEHGRDPLPSCLPPADLAGTVCLVKPEWP